MKPETAVKVQLNARVEPGYRKAANLLAAVANVTVDGFIEMLIRNAAEDDCGEAETFRKMRMVWKAVGEQLAFNPPNVGTKKGGGGGGGGTTMGPARPARRNTSRQNARTSRG